VTKQEETVRKVESAIQNFRNELEGIGLVSELDGEHHYTQAHHDEIQKLFERFADERNELADKQHQELFEVMERAFLDVGNTSGIKYLGSFH
jgi:uncharacterized coiled-coil DUF342 family protein